MLPVPATFPGFRPGERVLPRAGAFSPARDPLGERLGPGPPRPWAPELRAGDFWLEPPRGMRLLFRRAPRLQIRAAATKGAPPLSRHILPGKRSAGLPGVGGGGSLSFLFFWMQGTATPAFVSVGSELALKYRAVRKHTDSHLLIALRYAVCGGCRNWTWLAWFPFPASSLTAAAPGRSLFLQSWCLPALGSWRGSPEQWGHWLQLATYLLTLLGSGVRVTESFDWICATNNWWPYLSLFTSFKPRLCTPLSIEVSRQEYWSG